MAYAMNVNAMMSGYGDTYQSIERQEYWAAGVS